MDLMENVVRTRKNHIVPINQPLAGSYSFKEGSSLINFMLPASPQALLTNTLKMNFRLRCNQPTSTFQTPVLVNNNTNKSSLGEFQGLLDERNGVNSIIDTLTWSSGTTNSTLENIRAYGRLTATTNGFHNSQSDLDGRTQGENTACASRSNISGNMVNCENFYSIPLKCGLLEGAEDGIILMGRAGVNGLNLTIQLQNDMMVFKSNEANATDIFYSINDVFITYDTLEFTSEITEELNKNDAGEMNYASYSYIYSVINSSDDQLNLNLGVKSALSIFSTFVPTSHLNNVSVNSFSPGNLKNAVNGVYTDDATLSRVSFIRNGELSPLDHFNDVDTSSKENTPRPVLIETSKQALDVENSTRTLISPATQNGLLTKTNINGDEVSSLNTAVSVETQSNPLVVLGVNFDNISNQGRDFSGNNTYGLRTESSLNGNSPNSITTFVRSKNTLMYDNGAISVMS